MPFASSSSSGGAKRCPMDHGWRARFQYRHLVVPLHQDEAGNQRPYWAAGGEDIEAAWPSDSTPLPERSSVPSWLTIRAGSSSSRNTTPWNPTAMVVKRGWHVLRVSAAGQQSRCRISRASALSSVISHHCLLRAFDAPRCLSARHLPPTRPWSGKPPNPRTLLSYPAQAPDRRPSRRPAITF